MFKVVREGPLLNPPEGGLSPAHLGPPLASATPLSHGRGVGGEAYMQLTLPIAVARAVRAEMTVCTIQLQIFFFVSLSMVVFCTGKARSLMFNV